MDDNQILADNLAGELGAPVLKTEGIAMQEAAAGGGKASETFSRDNTENKDVQRKSTPEKSAIAHREILDVFSGMGLSLDSRITEMLEETKEHQGGRRGSGFTQVSRVLATDFVNSPRSDRDIGLFDHSVRQNIQKEFDNEFRSLSKEQQEDYVEPSYASRLGRQKLEELPGQMQNEESRMIAQMMVDVIYPHVPDESAISLPPATGEMHIGTCTTAEAYYFDYINKGGKVLTYSRANMNIIVDGNGEPIMLEKIGLGESHSALTLAPTEMNGVRLPAGSLVGVQYPSEIGDVAKGDSEGKFIKLEDCSGFKFLRLSTLAVDPAIRERAFGSHIEFQRNSLMEGADTVRIEDFSDKAKQRLVRNSLNAASFDGIIW